MKKVLVMCVVILLSLFISKVFAQVTFTSSNLPIVTINTNGQTIVDEPKINATIGIIYNGVGVRNNVTDLPVYSGKMGIEIRGSSSQSFPKKQYGIELWDALGVSIDTKAGKDGNRIVGYDGQQNTRNESGT